MVTDGLSEQIIKGLSDEFQSVWVVDLISLKIDVFTSREEGSIADSVPTVEKCKDFNEAREWYINNCVVPQDRPHLLEQTSIEYLSSKLASGKPYYIEYRRLNDFTINYNQVYIKKIGDKGHILIGFRDIDERKQAERDDLTGLYTKQVFVQKAEKMLQENPDVQYDLIVSDISNFKAINLTYGPAVGDDILRWVGSFLAPAIGDEVLVSRCRGDRFVIMAVHEFIQDIVGDLQTSYFEEEQASNGLPKTVVKYGIYENVPHDKEIMSTIRLARTALRSIKQDDKKKIAYFDEEMRKKAQKHDTIANSIQQGIKKDQFQVLYQPKHDPMTGKLIGAEALIRWKHPQYGMLEPADFIKIAEMSGNVADIDLFVWKRTCKNLRKWKDKGLQLVPISMNGSKALFDENELLEKLQKPVEENKLTPNLLSIEVNEKLTVYGESALIKRMASLRAIGYQVELDNFGAGDSSLRMLTELPLDVVKMDISFMQKFGDAKGSKVLAASLRLAKGLGYKTVSVGVETKEQYELLKLLGVDAIQGYYYSKPMGEKEFEDYLKKYTEK